MLKIFSAQVLKFKLNVSVEVVEGPDRQTCNDDNMQCDFWMGPSVKSISYMGKNFKSVRSGTDGLKIHLNTSDKFQHGGHVKYTWKINPRQ